MTRVRYDKETIKINCVSKNTSSYSLKISFWAYNLMMNSIPRILNIVAILTKNKDRKQIFLSIKLYKWRIKWLLPEQEEVALVFTGTKLDTKFNIKDKTSKEHQRDLTYSVVCPDANCSEEYNGETGRRLIERVHEHSGKNVNSCVNVD